MRISTRDILSIHSSSWFQTFAVFWMLYVVFWVIPRRLNFTYRRFGTLFHLYRQVGNNLPTKMEQGVPKRRHIKFRRRGITQKKTYSIRSSATEVSILQEFMGVWCLKYRGTRFVSSSRVETFMDSFETSITIPPLTWWHLPEERRSQILKYFNSTYLDSCLVFPQ